MFNDSVQRKINGLKTQVLFRKVKLFAAGEELKLTGSLNRCRCPCHQAWGQSSASTMETWQEAMPQVLEIPSGSPGTCLLGSSAPSRGSRRDPPCSGSFLQMQWVQAAVDKVASWTEGEQNTPYPRSLLTQ